MTDRLPARRSSAPPRPSRSEVPDVEPTVHVEAVRERVDQLIDEIDGRLLKLADADAQSLLEDTRATLRGLKQSLEAFAPPPPGRKGIGCLGGGVHRVLRHTAGSGADTGGGWPGCLHTGGRDLRRRRQ